MCAKKPLYDFFILYTVYMAAAKRFLDISIELYCLLDRYCFHTTCHFFYIFFNKITQVGGKEIFPL